MGNSQDEVTHISDGRLDMPIFVHSELDDLPLTCEAFRVYAHLARRAGRDNNAWPSYASIGRSCFALDYPKSPGTQRNHAINAVKELVTAGLIEKVANQTKHGDPGTNHYSLTPKKQWRISKEQQEMETGGTPAVLPSIPPVPKGTTVKGTTVVKESNSSSAPPPKKEDQPDPFTLFEQNGFGFPSIIITDMINEMIKEYGSPWVCEAMLEAVKQNKRNLKYTEGILRRWKASGKGNYIQHDFLGNESDPAIQLLISRQKEEKISAQLRLNLDQRKAITEAKITDMEKWKQVISAGRQRGYKLTNVEWMIDMYQKDLSNGKPTTTNHLDRRSQAKAASDADAEARFGHYNALLDEPFIPDPL